jgi:hypothetical protein
MGKRFGRNQKRKLKTDAYNVHKRRLDQLVNESSKLRWENERLNSIPNHNIGDDILSFQTYSHNREIFDLDQFDAYVTSIHVNVKNLLANRLIANNDELNILINNPELLVSEFTQHLRTGLDEYIPKVLNEIKGQMND